MEKQRRKVSELELDGETLYGAWDGRNGELHLNKAPEVAGEEIYAISCPGVKGADSESIRRSPWKVR